MVFSRSMAKTSSAKVDPNELIARIQQRAYELFEKGGCQPGHDLDNWLKAERQVKKELGIK